MPLFTLILMIPLLLQTGEGRVQIMNKQYLSLLRTARLMFNVVYIRITLKYMESLIIELLQLNSHLVNHMVI